MMRARLSFFLPFLAFGFLSGCDCAGPPAQPCTASSDCDTGLICLDGACQAPPDGTDAGFADGGSCTPDERCGGRMCCGAGEECVEDFACAPVCENARCGDNNLQCCAAGEVCLDGVVCAAACADDQALCGASFELCCDSGDVCVEDACTTPGEPCGDDFDCLTEGTYCEPTIGRCLANPAPAGKPGIAFALHVQSQGFASLRTFRREMALQLLTHIGAWPTPQ